MHVIFLNPQGNFDQNDSHMTEHPDFGGQLIYVKEICMSLTRLGVKVDIITRQIEDPDWPEFSREIDFYEGYEDNLRIVRIPCGGTGFLRKEELWEHMEEFTDNILKFYGTDLPDFATAHYADGGYCAVLLKKKAGIGFTFTAHSLGAQKLDKLGMDLQNFKEMDGHFFFKKRILAERLGMEHAFRIITSTKQERLEQYAHTLYKGAVDTSDDSMFSVIPPGVNINIFLAEHGPEDERVAQYISKVTEGSTKPFIIASSRFDEKKNPVGLVKAFADSPEVNKLANLCIVIRGVDEACQDVSCLTEQERELLDQILDIIDEESINKKVFFLNLQSQHELASAYRYFKRLNSVFALTAYYEPFGLAPIEAAACGLAVVATKNGGPSEIFIGGEGILVDPFDTEDIAHGLRDCLIDTKKYGELGRELVKNKYTWKKTAAFYLEIIKQGMGQSYDKGFDVPALDSSGLIMDYLASKNSKT